MIEVQPGQRCGVAVGGHGQRPRRERGDDQAQPGHGGRVKSEAQGPTPDEGAPGQGAVVGACLRGRTWSALPVAGSGPPRCWWSSWSDAAAPTEEADYTKLSQIALVEVSNELPYVLDRLLPLLAAAIDGNPVTR